MRESRDAARTKHANMRLLAPLLLQEVIVQGYGLCRLRIKVCNCSTSFCSAR